MKAVKFFYSETGISLNEARTLVQNHFELDLADSLIRTVNRIENGTCTQTELVSVVMVVSEILFSES